MATHVILVCRTDYGYIGKFIHYDTDKPEELLNASYDECFSSIADLGDSCTAFDGSYLDYGFCIHGLHWSERYFFTTLKEHVAKVFESFAQVTDYALDHNAEVIYVADKVLEKGKKHYVSIYEWLHHINDFICLADEEDDDDYEERPAEYGETVHEDNDPDSSNEEQEEEE